MRGRIESYSGKFHVGFIAPTGGGELVLFTLNAVAGGCTPVVGQSVEHELYAQSRKPEAKRVVCL